MKAKLDGRDVDQAKRMSVTDQVGTFKTLYITFPYFFLFDYKYFVNRKGLLKVVVVAVVAAVSVDIASVVDPVVAAMVYCFCCAAVAVTAVVVTVAVAAAVDAVAVDITVAVVAAAVSVATAHAVFYHHLFLF